MRTAQPKVQLVGHAVFTPPVDENGKRPFEPDIKTFFDVFDEGHADSAELYDAQALIEFAGRSCYESYNRPRAATAENDGYMRNIIEVGHFSILEHSMASFYITGVSRSCTHELVRHRHLSPSQLSQRFVFGGEVNYVIPPALLPHMGGEIGSILGAVQQFVDAAYGKIVNQLEESGLNGKPAREAARAVLPNMTETKIALTGNYRAWMEFLIKRDSPHADAEIQGVARLIGNELATLAPNVFGDGPRSIWNPDR